MIDSALVEIALGRVRGQAFERFFHAFLAAIQGQQFTPLGGHHDGGADAFLEPIYEGGQPTHFFQASVEKDHRTKIRQTVERIRTVGRDLKQLTYVTSRTIERIDQEDDDLTTELDVTIRIRDQKWIIANINESTRTQSSFNDYLRPELAFLSRIGGSTLIESMKQDDQRSMFVFLEQELARRRDQSDILQSTIDSLILWALEGTDPDQGRFMTRSAILARIEQVLPSAKHFVRSSLGHRIEKLSSRSNETGREIRHHRKDDLFCLPYETRQLVQEENANDELLKQHFLDELGARASPHLIANEDRSTLLEIIVQVAHKAIENTFEHQGMELAAFVSGNGAADQQLSISEYVDEALDEHALNPKDRQKVKDVAIDVLRMALYESTPADRSYFNKLSRTFALLFTLRNDARVVEYFRSMSTKLVLYVGADLLVRALSEHYLRPDDRMTTNLLLILRKSGAELILGSRALEEVWTHIKATDHEFVNWFKWSEPNITTSIVRHCSKILIRSYFYAKLSPPEGVAPPDGWMRYLDQFVTYGALHSSRGREELQAYLCAKFGLKFESDEEMHNGVNADHLEALKEMLLKVRSNKEKGDLLAYNDALQVLRVYAKRKEIKDRESGGPFGYRVWWLTHETYVTQVSGDLVKFHNARYIMRPEFVLNFIALAPTMEEVRRAYSTVFPSILSIRLSNRMSNDVFHEIMGRYKRSCEYDPARIEAKTIELNNRLKSDNFKAYEVEIRAERSGGEN